MANENGDETVCIEIRDKRAEGRSVHSTRMSTGEKEYAAQLKFPRKYIPKLIASLERFQANPSGESAWVWIDPL